MPRHSHFNPLYRSRSRNLSGSVYRDGECANGDDPSRRHTGGGVNAYVPRGPGGPGTRHTSRCVRATASMRSLPPIAENRNCGRFGAIEAATHHSSRALRMPPPQLPSHCHAPDLARDACFIYGAERDLTSPRRYASTTSSSRPASATITVSAIPRNSPCSTIPTLISCLLFGRETHASTTQSDPLLLPTRNGPCREDGALHWEYLF